ncbi:hypothetical protein KM043_004008 [Ampulex compressa]|nr:hypothetical protein KM043_004008 [Ampulex compressa]
MYQNLPPVSLRSIAGKEHRLGSRSAWNSADRKNLEPQSHVGRPWPGTRGIKGTNVGGHPSHSNPLRVPLSRGSVSSERVPRALEAGLRLAVDRKPGRGRGRNESGQSLATDFFDVFDNNDRLVGAKLAEKSSGKEFHLAKNEDPWGALERDGSSSSRIDRAGREIWSDDFRDDRVKAN